jgi:phosphohistidine phosphatase SixA
VPGQTRTGPKQFISNDSVAVVSAAATPQIRGMTIYHFARTLESLRTGCRAILMATLIALAAILPVSVAQAEPLAEAIAKIDADVLFLRHALAPGYGDPAQFDVADCATQRNLNDEGRAQSRAIGAYMMRHDIVPDAIFSSQWCRCQDTASEMAIGPFTTHIGLNSFFNGHVDRDRTLAALRTHMAQIAPNRLELMVTHQVVISAITGIAPRSGGIVVYNSRTGDAVSVSIMID